jgi:hypothetical protein
MTVNEAIDKIKVLLNTQEGSVVTPDVPTAMNFDTYDLMDGSKIDLSSLEIGADAMLVDTTGNSVVCPDAEYELADGTSIVVTGGKISEIALPSSDAIEGETPGTEMPGQMPGMKMSADKFEAVELGISELKAKNDALKAELELIEGKFNIAISQILDLVSDIAKAPSAEPTQIPKSTFANIEKKADKESRFLERIKTLKS